MLSGKIFSPKNHRASYLILAKRDHKNIPLFSKLRMLPLIPWG
jgi:hypothetical protein